MYNFSRSSGGSAFRRLILVVDDDQDFRAAVRDLLVDAGFEVQTARNGQDALEVLEKIDTPALILLDFMMPEMNGRQFLAARRRDERLRSIPVVILSAQTREWASGVLDADQVIAKPIDADELIMLATSYCAGEKRRIALK